MFSEACEFILEVLSLAVLVTDFIYFSIKGSNLAAPFGCKDAMLRKFKIYIRTITCHFSKVINLLFQYSLELKFDWAQWSGQFQASSRIHHSRDLFG